MNTHYVQLTFSVSKYIIQVTNLHICIQLTLEQHRFELSGSTYSRIFSTISATVLPDPWLVESLHAEPQI